MFPLALCAVDMGNSDCVMTVIELDYCTQETHFDLVKCTLTLILHSVIIFQGVKQIMSECKKVKSEKEQSSAVLIICGQCWHSHHPDHVVVLISRLGISQNHNEGTKMLWIILVFVPKQFSATVANYMLLVPNPRQIDICAIGECEMILYSSLRCHYPVQLIGLSNHWILRQFINCSCFTKSTFKCS